MSELICSHSENSSMTGRSSRMNGFSTGLLDEGTKACFKQGTKQ